MIEIFFSKSNTYKETPLYHVPYIFVHIIRMRINMSSKVFKTNCTTKYMNLNKYLDMKYRLNNISVNIIIEKTYLN